MKKVYETATVHGMCGGVFAALQQVEKLLQQHRGEAVYILHELVHNRQVSAALASGGAVFIDDVSALPPGAVGVIGAHGVAKAVESALHCRSERIIDTTCPLVKKLHRFAAQVPPEAALIILGKAEHPEVQGIAGNAGTDKVFIISAPEKVSELPELPQELYYLSQTTVDFQLASRCEAELRCRFPAIRCCPGVCGASQQRQQAVREMASRCDAVLIVGSSHSSNACRLREIAAEYSPEAVLIESAEDIAPELLARHCRIGVSAGASTPAEAMAAVIGKLEAAGFTAG
ncbi:MAG: 4-hydroxy-3-methylbut-2-enyl diphosphate reductase [Lentisphaeria bacterium]|nr:4-hydroxy-3-methylbut-2-enyl diphosphate reductase [Lentisphaeria bacterium]